MASQGDERCGESPVRGEGSESRAVDAVVGSEREHLTSLANAMGKVLDSCPAGQQSALHDFAIRLVCDLTSGREHGGKTEAEADARFEGSGGATLLGYGLLIVPVGVLVAMVLPVGVVLFAGGLLLIVAGALWCAVARVWPRRDASEGPSA